MASRKMAAMGGTRELKTACIFTNSCSLCVVSIIGTQKMVTAIKIITKNL